ncbi:hypothetical protein ACFS4T_04785 [Pseudomonas lini]
MGADPALVRRLLLDYRQTPLGYCHLSAAHDQAFTDLATAENRPPLEFNYSEFNLPSVSQWKRFEKHARPQ